MSLSLHVVKVNNLAPTWNVIDRFWALRILLNPYDLDNGCEEPCHRLHLLRQCSGEVGIGCLLQAMAGEELTR